MCSFFWPEFDCWILGNKTSPQVRRLQNRRSIRVKSNRRGLSAAKEPFHTLWSPKGTALSTQYSSGNGYSLCASLEPVNGSKVNSKAIVPCRLALLPPIYIETRGVMQVLHIFHTISIVASYSLTFSKQGLSLSFIATSVDFRRPLCRISPNRHAHTMTTSVSGMTGIVR